MLDADRIIFIGTSFSVNITAMALEIAIGQNIPIEIVDPQPVAVDYANCCYHRMTAAEYIRQA
jgi:NAD-dependent deacetylase